MKNSNKKTILISGATSGIGLATAHCYAAHSSKQQPIQLILIARRYDRLKKISNKIKAKYSVEVFTSKVDISNPKQIQKFLDNKKIPLKDIDILINNAGLAAGKDSFAQAQISDWEQMIDTNIKGLLYLTKGILAFFLKKKSGHIVNIGSVAGKQVYPHGSVYCASKAAVHSISEGLRLDLHGTGIRVSSINPGMVETEFSLVRFKGNKNAAQSVYKNTRALTANDIANTIYWTTSQPPHVNIQEILIMPTDQASARDVYRVP